MNSNDKYQSPYRGFWVVMLLMILIPLIAFWLINDLFSKYSRFSEVLDIASAKALGCGIGFLFHLSFIISGVLTPGWQAVKYRIGEFFENLVVGVGYAFKTYLEDMRDDGVTFLFQLIVILINLAIALDGLRDTLLLMGYI